MKRMIQLALAAAFAVTLAGAGLAQAQPYQGPPPPGFRPGGPPPRAYPWGGPARPGWHHWRAGDRFRGSRYMIPNWRGYALPPPRPGFFWVRSGGEFVMLGGNGVVGSVIIDPRYP